LKIVLISPGPVDLYSPGVRSLSAFLKREGHKVRMIILQGKITGYRFKKNFIYHYKDSLITDVVEHCKGFDLVGVSFMTNWFDRAVQVTEAIKGNTNLPVIWGGDHATVAPEVCIDYVDMVCIGEGEEALLELVNKMDHGGDISKIRNLWVRVNDKVAKKTVRPLITDLDSLPFIDYELEDDYVINQDGTGLVKLDKPLLKRLTAYYPDVNGNYLAAYKTMITRGCPLKCAYCGIYAIKALYKGENYLRRRSNQNMIDELLEAKEKLDFIQIIHFQDDVFFSTSTDNIRKFCELYKTHIGLPFRVQASPNTTNEKKLDLMIDVGLTFTELGVQSGSRRTLNMYERSITNERLLKTIDMINKRKDKLNPPDYHLIIDNPWEDIEDLKETLRLLWKLPRPYHILLSSLTFYPGTALYKKAKEEGLIKDEKSEIYRKHFITPKGSYINFIIYLTTLDYFPRWILKLMIADILIKIFHREYFNKSFELAYRFAFLSNKVVRGVKSLLKGELLKNIHHVRRIVGYHR
jgi:anaerobic magnesium-protoporphyrin IX monomethyl ester cyclase